MRVTKAMLEESLKFHREENAVLRTKYCELERQLEFINSKHRIDLQAQSTMIVALEKTTDAVAHVLGDIRGYRKETR